MTVSLANASAHLEYVHEIGVEGDFHHEFYWREMEVLQSQLVEQHIAGQQLLAANVHGVLRQIERIAQRDAAGGELDARSKCFFGAGRKHHRPLAADLQLQPAEKTGVVVKQPDIGSARRRDVSGDGGRKESLAVNQSEIIDFTRCAISSAEWHTYPETPSRTTSSTAPPGSASVGAPQAMASIITRPKGSFHCMGNNRARAPMSSLAFSSRFTSPTYSIWSPRCGLICCSK